MKNLFILSLGLFASTIAFGQQKKVARNESTHNIKPFFVGFDKIESKQDYFKRMAATNRKSLVDKKYYAVNKYKK